MKYIKLFESYDIKDIYSWWSGIKVSEDDEYYIINLDAYLNNKIIQLNNGLKSITVSFYCNNHDRYEQLKIKNIEYNETYGKLLFYGEYRPGRKDAGHVVEISKPIKISKDRLTTDKYNL